MKKNIKSAKYNPRKISDKALSGLRDSINVFGDLSGLVINTKTGVMVCGHQRRSALKNADLSTIHWGAPFSVELGQTDARFKSRERDGFLITPAGARFHARQVNWPEAFEKAANIAANNPHLQGEFTPDVEQLIEEIHANLPGLPKSLNYDALLKGLQTSATSASVSENYIVMVTCEDEEQQAELLMRLDKEGFKCRAVIS